MLVVPIGLAMVLVPFSILIGWNLVTLILFWFVAIPALTIYMPAKVSNSRNHLLESLAGLILFYVIMVFMIYEHYQTDYFRLMMLSGVINVGLVAAISLTRKQRTQIQ